MKKVKVLIVEDSILFSELLVRSISSDPSLEVVAVARDPYEARDAIIRYDPDVMTLDIELPRMSGLEFLRKLMPQHPMPVVVISVLNDKVFDALSFGAVDFVNKPSNLTLVRLGEFMKNELVAKVKIASMVRPERINCIQTPLNPVNIGLMEKKDLIIAIGASTGGTEAIRDVVKGFNIDIPGVVVVQHMPPGFTAMYAERLNSQCRVSVKEARTGDRVMSGQVLIAPGDAHMKVVRINGVYQVECRQGAKVNGHCPSVDVLFDSVAKVSGNNAVGIILTGMGKDGARGLLEMRKAGARTIGQDETTSVVYGMPKEAYDNGAVQCQMGIDKISAKTYAILNEM